MEGSLRIFEGAAVKLARIQDVQRVERLEDLVAPIWESDEELQRFLADVYAARTSRND